MAIKKKMDPVVHFEMPYEDRDRMVDFYTTVFGWEANKLGAEMGNYVVLMTSETNEQTHLPKEPGRIGGGFFERSEDVRCPLITIAVDDIRKAMKKVQDAGGVIIGGRVEGQPDDIPGVGLYIAFVDTEGNRVSLLQPREMSGIASSPV
ncbi:MAG TPA: VOC family protein [Candidatus Paceibacterota bacterium]